MCVGLIQTKIHKIKLLHFKHKPSPKWQEELGGGGACHIQDIQVYNIKDF